MNKIDLLLLSAGDLHTLTGGYIYNKQLLNSLNRDFNLSTEVLPVDTITSKKFSDYLSNFSGVIIIDGLLSTLGKMSLIDLISKNSSKVFYLAHLPSGEQKAYEKENEEMEAELISLSQAVISTGQITFEFLKQKFPQKNHFLIEPGIKNANVKKNYNTHLNHMVSSGSLIPRKGYLELIDSLQSFRSQNWKLDILGPKDRDLDYLKELNTRIFQYGLELHVNIVGAISQEESWQRVVSSDLFISSSLHETFGMSAQEAVSFKVPTLLTDLPVYKERFANTPVVWVEKGHVDSLSQAIGKLLLSNKEYISFARLWKEFPGISSRSWRTVAKDWVTLFNS